jgi:hypothetical protein
MSEFTSKLVFWCTGLLTAPTLVRLPWFYRYLLDVLLVGGGIGYGLGVV